MKLDRRTLERIAKRKMQYRQWVDAEGIQYCNTEKGSRVDHWHEGSLVGRSNALSDALEILGIYEEVVKLIVKMDSEEYWTLDEIDELHEEALTEYEEYMAEQWESYLEDGGTMSYERWAS